MINKKMVMKKTLLLLILVFGAQSSFSQVMLGDKKEIEKIVQNINLFSEYYTSGNYDALANAYCKEGVILPPGADIIKGREKIKQRWKLPDGISVLYHKITPVEISVNGNWAYDIGYYEGTNIKRNGEEVNFKGKYVIVWKKEEGDWKIYADAWNRIND